MLVNQIVPGQEEGNFALLRRHDVGGFVETPGAAVAALRRAFAARGALWSRWRATLTHLARPDASREIVRHLLTRVAPTARVSENEDALHP
jgi:processive 1,2-diacylglycerol beta-glucosyltransferase